MAERGVLSEVGGSGLKLISWESCVNGVGSTTSVPTGSVADSTGVVTGMMVGVGMLVGVTGFAGCGSPVIAPGPGKIGAGV